MTARILSRFHPLHPRSLGGVAMILAVALLVGVPVWARAGLCPAPAIDGSLQDMIDFAHCPDLVGCGLVQSDDPQDICADASFDPCQNGLIIPCPAAPSPAKKLGAQIYFPNGADIVTAVSAYDATSDVLYLGLRTVFAIGDADGDNDPGVNPANCDGTNITEQPGIGSQEAYNFFIDTNCDGVPDITVEVANNDVTVSPPAGTTSLNFNGTDLEVSVTGLGLPTVYCFAGFAGFTFDGLAEDQTVSRCCPQPTPDILVELDCPGTICPGNSDNITATVTNTGDSPLSGVTLTIPLPASLNFTSFVDEDGWDSCAEAAGTITCTESDLPLFGVRVVTFAVTAKPDCDGTNTVPATATGTFTQPGCVEESGAFDDTSCDIACSLPPCSITGDNAICTGETTQFCAPAGMASYAWTGPGGFTATTQCITVGVAGEYCVTVTDANGCVSNCCQTLTVEDCGGGCLLIIDEDSIDNGAKAIEELAEEGVCGGGIPAVCVNDQLANPGVRLPLPIPVGTIIGSGVPGGTTEPLWTGQLFDEGWFRLEVAPESWVTAGPTSDGLLNYFLAEADGFGRNGEFLLDKIPDVTPLRTADLQALVGEVCCAVVYDSDVSINYDPLLGNLQGANLGILHLRVLAVGEPDDEVLPDITIEVLDPSECFAHSPGESGTPTLVGEGADANPTRSWLYPSAPNPATSTTSFRYALPAPSSLHLAIYDVTGRLVRVLANLPTQAAGEYTVSWDGHDDQGSRVAPGVYVYRLHAGEHSESRTMRLVR
jgi:FlgD Ig-like domain